MARRKEMTCAQKELIIKLWNNGKSYRNISSDTNIPFSTIGSFIARFKKNVILLRTKADPVLPGRSLPDYEES